MNFFCLLNFIFHQLLITHNSVTITLIKNFHAGLQSSVHIRLPKRQRHAFLQERIQKVVKKKRRKKAWVTGDLERARPKEMFPLTFKKKVEVEPKNRKNI